jgi:PAS domain S-box-containing protein
LLGYDADTLCTLPVEALMPQTIRGEHEEKRKQYAQSPSIRAMGEKQELFALHRDGRYIPVDIGLTPIESDEGPMVVAALIDLTDRKAAEKALKAHAKELERSNQELDRFAYIASHDLKAPLRAIDHLAHWIAEDAGEVLPESSRADLVLLQQRVGRMAELLDSLLAYSRIGRNQSEPEAIDLGCLVRDILAMLEIPDAFTVTVAADLPTLQAPKTPVDLVLRNLIGNALKHHDRADGCLAISGRDLGDRVEVMVADDGPGIAPVYHEQIFQMFQTLKPRDEVEGSGIGLALVKKTVEHYGGTIAVEAEETAGAQFRLTWPKHPTRRT